MDSKDYQEKHVDTDMVESIAANHHGVSDDERHWWQQPGLRSLYILMGKTCENLDQSNQRIFETLETISTLFLSIPIIPMCIY